MQTSALFALVIGLCLFEDIDAARSRLKVELRGSYGDMLNTLNEVHSTPHEQSRQISRGELSNSESFIPMPRDEQFSNYVDRVEALEAGLQDTDSQTLQLAADVQEAVKQATLNIQIPKSGFKWG